MRGFIHQWLALVLLLCLPFYGEYPAWGQPAPAAVTDVGTPHAVELFVDVAEVNARLEKDINELADPKNTNAELWIATWTWANDYYLNVEKKVTLLNAIKSALVENPNLKVYVLLWDMPGPANILLDLGWVQFKKDEAYEGLTEDAKQRLVIADENLFLRHPISSAHQKFMLLQYGGVSAGYCCDYNNQNFYWDWNDHNSARRAQFGLEVPPVHDTAIRFEGMAVKDFREEFLYRWQKSSDNKGKVPQAEFAVSMKHAGSASAFGKAGAKSLPNLRARFQEPGTTGGEIKDWYRWAIQNARDYVYIENQYLDDPDIADDLIEAYFRKLNWAQPNVVVNLCSTEVLAPRSQINGTFREVMRIRLSTADKIVLKNGRVIQRSGRWRNVIVNKRATQAHLRGRAMDGTIDFDDIARIEGGVRFYTMVTAAASPKVGFQPVYIHSKVGIIDNKLSIGSANQNRRSYGTDYEANVMLTDTATSKEVEAFRSRIMTILAAPDAAGTTPLQRLEHTAAKNTKARSTNPQSTPIGLVIDYPLSKNRK